MDLSVHGPHPPSTVAEKMPVTNATPLDEGSVVQGRKEEVVASNSASGLQKDQGGRQGLLQHYCSRPPLSAIGIVVS